MKVSHFQSSVGRRGPSRVLIGITERHTCELCISSDTCHFKDYEMLSEVCLEVKVFPGIQRMFIKIWGLKTTSLLTEL